MPTEHESQLHVGDQMAVASQTIRKAESAMKAAMRRFGHRKNITGFATGFRRKDGKLTREICVRIHVSDKIPKEELTEGQAFPDQIDGVGIDVIRGRYVAGTERGQGVTRGRHTVAAGLACGPVQGGRGTVGAIVVDAETQGLGLLSSWHVLWGASGKADDQVAVQGVAGMNPVASLSRSLLGRGGDAAFATFRQSVSWLPVPVGLTMGLRPPRPPQLGEALIKSGAATQVTEAIVEAAGTYQIRYETSPGVRETVEIEAFMLSPATPGAEISRRGDSGACWLDPKTGEAVGLHIAGESQMDAEEYALACPMGAVLDGLGLRIADFEDFERLNAAALAGIVPSVADTRPADRSVPGWPKPWPIPMPMPWPWPWPFPSPLPPIGPPPDPLRGQRTADLSPGISDMSGMIALERAPGTISINGDIWPLLAASAATGVGSFGWGINLPLSPSAKLSDALSSDVALFARQLVALRPLGKRMSDDGVSITAARLKHVVTYAGVAQAVGLAYELAGWTVTS